MPLRQGTNRLRTAATVRLSLKEKEWALNTAVRFGSQAIVSHCRYSTPPSSTGSNLAEEPDGCTAVSEGAYLAIFLRLRIIDLDLQHRKTPLQISCAILDTVFRLKLSLHATIDYNRIAARRQLPR